MCSTYAMSHHWDCTLLWQCLCLAAVISMLPGVSCQGNEFFIGAGPVISNYAGPMGTVIYRLDEAGDSLRTVWSLPADDYFYGVKLYSACRTAVVFAGPYGYSRCDRLYLVPFDSISSATTPILDYRKDSMEVNDCRYREDSSGHPFLKVLVQELPRAAGRRSTDVFIDLLAGKISDTRDILMAANIRLAGNGPAMGGDTRDGETRRLTLSQNGNQWEPSDSNLRRDSRPIPDSVIQMKTSFGWNLIANEPGFRVLASVPDRGGLVSRELLVYNCAKDTWSPIMIPGAVTKPRLLGDWLGGVVLDDDPAANYEKRFSGPPVPREEVVLIRPLDLHSFTVRLGQWAELLSIQGDTVIYRVGEELYRARIQDDDLVDRHLLVKDAQVFGINWAFSGREQ